MKKWMWILIIVLVVCGGGTAGYFAMGRESKPAAAPAPTGKVEIASLRQVVQTTGKVTSNLDVDIKCKASGEIISLPFDVSDSVRKGQLLMELDPADEQRLVDQAKASLDSSRAKLKIAEMNLQVAQRTLATDNDRAKSACTASLARKDDSEAKANRVKDLLDKKLASQEDYETAKTAAIQADSDYRACQIRLAELETQKEALELMRQQVELAKAQVVSDQISWDLAKQRLDDTKIVAPIDGVVTARNVQIGMIASSAISNVGGGTAALTLSDMSRIFVLASVDESDIGKVALGQEVSIGVDAYPGKKFAGKVVRIDTKGVNVSNVVTFNVNIEVQPGEATSTSRPKGSRPTRGDAASAPAETSGPASTSSAPARSGRRGPATDGGERGDKSLLKPEMTANLEVICAERENVLTVPYEAVIRKGGKNYVTVMDDSTPKDVPVELGLSDGTRTEILSGVSEGQTVQLYKSDASSKWQSQLRQPGMNPGRMMGGGGRRG